MLQATIQCPECQAPNKREIVNPIHPGAYTNPADAGMSSTFWCEACSCPLTVRFTFSLGRNNNIKVTTTEVRLEKGSYQYKPFGGITIRPKQKSYKS